jgi:hypothetical protein
MSFRSKLEKLFKLQLVREVEGAEVYLVSWTARYGEYCADTKRVAKAFFNYDDAKQFAKSLEDAHKLLQNTTNLNIQIEKQQ